MKHLILYLLAILFISGETYAATGDVLDRAGLEPSFADEFDNFHWYAEDIDGVQTKGTWRTNFGYRWCPLNDIRNHSLIWNKELQVYVDPLFRGSADAPLKLSAIQANDGVLRITASEVADDSPGLYGYQYTSGLITSEPSFSQTYGVFEMRAKLPKGRGLWPAFWLLPADKSWPPEIDVMEALGHDVTSYYTTLHSKHEGKRTKSDIPAHKVPDVTADFHTYALDWRPDEMIFYFDDREVARRPTPGDMHKPFYILINLAVGGSWPGSPDATTSFPAHYDIDWVRVHKRVGN